MDQPWMIVTILKQLLDSCDIYWQFRTANSFSQNYFTIKSDREQHWQFSRYLHLQIIFSFRIRLQLIREQQHQWRQQVKWGRQEGRRSQRSRTEKTWYFSQDIQKVHFCLFLKSSTLLVLDCNKEDDEKSESDKEESKAEEKRPEPDLIFVTKKCHKIFAQFLDKTKTSAKKGTHQTS